MQRSARMRKELRMLEEEPPHGVSCWAVDGQIDHLQAKIVGAEGTPYHGGIFKIDIQIPERYPFEPPKLRFVTPIYHPNIDNSGRICLDTIKMPPKGMWKPSLNVSSVLSTILLLMDKPNPDDPLMAEISNEYRYNYAQFVEKAKQSTLKYATDNYLINQGQVQNEETSNSKKSSDKEATSVKKLETSDSDTNTDSDSDEENKAPAAHPQGVRRKHSEEASTSGPKPTKFLKLK